MPRYRHDLLAAVIAMCLVFVAPRAYAQQETSFAILVGGGSRTGSGGDYISRNGSNGGVVSFAARRPLRDVPLSLVAQVEADGFVWGVQIRTSCAIPYGMTTCMPDFPQFSGASTTAGLMLTAIPRVELRATVGPGVYFSGHSSDFAVVEQVDAAVYPLSHLGIVVGRKVVTIPDYHAQWLRVTGGFMGLRLRW